MTREEAINHLKTIAHAAIDSGYDSAVVDAVAMAAMALKAAPCEDCVSRKAAIDACDQSINVLDATDRIKALPLVTLAQKTGYWVIVNERAGIYRCGVCNELSCCSSFYCHNCGAKMQEVEE